MLFLQADFYNCRVRYCAVQLYFGCLLTCFPSWFKLRERFEEIVRQTEQMSPTKELMGHLKSGSIGFEFSASLFFFSCLRGGSGPDRAYVRVSPF